MKNLQFRAAVLVEALPQLQKYTGKIVVVKYGGAAMQSDELREAVINDIVFLTDVGVRVVLVHGGGNEINENLGKMQIEPQFIRGLRRTDRATMDVVQMTLCGQTGKNLCAMVTRQGGRAVNLSGLDGELMSAVRKSEELGYIGNVVATNPHLVKVLLDAGYLPIISTVAHGIDEDTGYNINADTAAAALSAALGAEKLILLTDVPGLLRDKDDEDSVIRDLTRAEAEALLEAVKPESNASRARFAPHGVTIGKGMIPKLQCCVDALHKGVHKVSIVDGRVKHAVLMELLTDEGIGTMIT